MTTTSDRRILPRRFGALLAAGIGLALAVPTWQTPAVAAPVADAGSSTGAAAGWLAASAPTGVFTTGDLPDWGLTADAVLALAAGGRGSTVGAVATDQLAAHIRDFASDPVGTGRNAGSIAKLLVVASVQGHDVTSFGGWDLRAELLARMSSSGAQTGRFRSVGVPDTTNGFSQALGIIGLARTGTVPAEAVTFLLAQQCPGGSFRLFYLGDACTEAAAADPDATALAVQALLAARADGVSGTDAPLADALDWLEVVQGADGSFTAAGPQGVPNVNSTGLAAQSLRAAGRTAAADAAATWVRGLQLDCADAVPAADRGAIAYDSVGHAETLTAGVVDDMYRDQFVRATTQGLLALGAPSLVELDAASAPSASGFDCSAPPTSTTLPGASTTAPGATSTTLPGSTTTTTSTTPTSTSTTAAVTTTSTTIPFAGSATSVVRNAVEVAGISQTSGRSSSGTSASSLAATGSPAGRRVLAAASFVLSGVLFAAARRARRA